MKFFKPEDFEFKYDPNEIADIANEKLEPETFKEVK